MARVTKPRAKNTGPKLKKDGTPKRSGGRRKGAGRPTVEESIRRRDQSVKSFRQRYLIQPLDYAMCILNDIDPATHQPAAKAFSKAEKHWATGIAIPYLNQRLSAMQLTGADGGAIKYALDVNKLSEEDLVVLERMMLKASQPQNDPDNDNDDDNNNNNAEMALLQSGLK